MTSHYCTIWAANHINSNFTCLPNKRCRKKSRVKSRLRKNGGDDSCLVQFKLTSEALIVFSTVSSARINQYVNKWDFFTAAAGLVQYVVGELSSRRRAFEFHSLPPTHSSAYADYIKHVWAKWESPMACPDWSRGVKIESLETLIPPNNQGRLAFFYQRMLHWQSGEAVFAQIS